VTFESDSKLQRSQKPAFDTIVSASVDVSLNEFPGLAAVRMADAQIPRFESRNRRHYEWAAHNRTAHIVLARGVRISKQDLQISGKEARQTVSPKTDFIEMQMQGLDVVGVLSTPRSLRAATAKHWIILVLKPAGQTVRSSEGRKRLRPLSNPASIPTVPHGIWVRL
jgi:hypothetical protein